MVDWLECFVGGGFAPLKLCSMTGKKFSKVFLDEFVLNSP